MFQIRDQVNALVLRGVANYHKDATYAKLQNFRSRIESLYNHTLIHEPSKFRDDLIELREDLYHDRESFLPLSFDSSTNYDPSIFITCMGPYLALYMAVSYETEKYLNDKEPLGGALKTTKSERKNFLEEMKIKAKANMISALDKRESEIKTLLDSYNKYYSFDQMTGLAHKEAHVEVWQRSVEWDSANLGLYSILAHKLREEAKNVIQKNIFDPLNIFLTNAKIASLGQFVDRKVLLRLTTYGKLCQTRCEENESGTSKWCAYRVPATDGQDWDYCSSPNKTITNKDCKGECKKEGKNYYWCKTANSWDYCSPEQEINELRLKWKGHRYISGTVYGKYCATPCRKNVTGYWWCDKVGVGWDYCSPFNKDYELTFKVLQNISFYNLVLFYI